MRPTNTNQSTQIDTNTGSPHSSTNMGENQTGLRIKTTPRRIERRKAQLRQHKHVKRAAKAENLRWRPEYYKVEEVRNHRKTENGTEYLIHWTGYDSEEDSWVSAGDLRCPEPLINYLSKQQ